MLLAVTALRRQRSLWRRFEISLDKKGQTVEGIFGVSQLPEEVRTGFLYSARAAECRD